MNITALIGQNWSAIRQAGRDFLSAAPPDAFEQAAEWYRHPAWEVRAFALVIAALREWVAEKPTSKSRRVIAKFALKNAVKEDTSLQLFIQ